MKVVKLTGIFLLIVAAVVGALLLTGNGSQSDGSGGSDPETFSNISRQIDKEWKGAPWDMGRYKQTYLRIQQHDKALGKEGIGTLVDKLNEHAIPMLSRALDEEWSKTDCSKAKIDTLRQGLALLLDYSADRQSDRQVKEMTATCDLYDKAIALATLSQPMATGWDGRTSWTPFATHQKRLIGQRTAIQADTHYDKIRNIADIADGLAQLESKLKAKRGAYGIQVANQIYATYSKRYNNESFQKAKAQYEKEFGTNAKLNALARSHATR